MAGAEDTGDKRSCHSRTDTVAIASDCHLISLEPRQRSKQRARVLFQHVSYLPQVTGFFKVERTGAKIEAA